MSAALALLRLASQADFYETLEAKGRRLSLCIDRAIEKMGVEACLQRSRSMFTLFFGRKKVERAESLDGQTYRRFFRFMLDRGVYMAPAQNEAPFFSSCHGDEELGYVGNTIVEFLSSEFM